jgi:gas vesicle protein
MPRERKVAPKTTDFILNLKYMENKFKKGIVLGSILAVAGIAFGLSRTKKGQELSEDLQKDLKALAKKLKKQLAKLEDISKEKYEETVKMVTEEYAKKKELALDAKEKLISALKEKWSEAEQEYDEDDEDEE